MSAFMKTLVGDVRNVCVVAGVVAVAAALVFASLGWIAAFAIPPLTLAGVAWLARG